MGTSGLQVSGDLGWISSSLVLALVVLTFVLLASEGRRAARAKGAVIFSGALATLLLAVAVLRPVVRSEVKEPSIARVTVLVDASQRMMLPGRDGGVRSEQIARALSDLERSLTGARVQVQAFADGRTVGPFEAKPSGPPRLQSDFEQAIQTAEADESSAPNAVIVIADGRRTGGARAGDPGQDREIRPGVRVHTVRLLDAPLVDRSLLKVAMPDSVVAHEPFRVDVELSCTGGLSCDKVQLSVFELLQGGQREQRAEAQPELLPDSSGHTAKASLRVTLDRAGPRVIEVDVASDPTDQVPENNRRFLEVNVRRDRLRLLHVAGRPTYDVRALRTFLKSDRSLDLVAFFILRTATDHVMASQSELALIPFPVDELFTEHLPSFDAVILQDIDAAEYGVAAHFRSLRDYVRKGGGLALIGGPSMFGAGGYADSPLADVSPVAIVSAKKTADMSPFVPSYTRVGREAPLLQGLRALLGDELPEVTGVNLVGRAEPRAYVLWEHPVLAPLGGSADDRMPILALREVGDGRTLALTLDSTHQLRFGPEGAKSAGRAHGALWEGMLGWLMRDSRFELLRARAPWPCISGRPFRVEVETLGEVPGSVELDVEPLGRVATQELSKSVGAAREGGKAPVFEFEGLTPGGYAALIQIGKEPPVRFVFACEAGGDAWADSRPDPERLKAWSQARGGVSVTPQDIRQVPLPDGTSVVARSINVPVLPDIAWSTLAALALGIHWLVRRYGGLL